MEKNKKEERKQVKINLKRTWNYIKLAKGNLVYYVVVSIIEAIISILLPIVSAKIILNMTDGLFLQLILTGLVVLFLHSIVRLISFFKTVFYKRIFNVTIEAMKMR